jgi:hypothetical protein
MGYGLVAAGAVRAGDVLLQVPKAVWEPVSAEFAHAQASNRAPSFVRHVEGIQAQLMAGDTRGSERFVQHVMLAMHVLFERQGESNSVAAPYVGALKNPDVPLFWGHELSPELVNTATARYLHNNARTGPVPTDSG